MTEEPQADGLAEDELDAEQGELLPDREELSVVDLGDGSLGPPPLTE